MHWTRRSHPSLLLAMAMVAIAIGGRAIAHQQNPRILFPSRCRESSNRNACNKRKTPTRS